MTSQKLEERALREIRETILSLKDDLLVQLMRNPNTVGSLERMRVRRIVDQYRGDDLSQQMEEILSRFMRWSYEDGVTKIDGMLEGGDLADVLNLPKVNIDLAAVFQADKIVTIAPTLIDAVSSKVTLAFVGSRTPAEVIKMISKAFDAPIANAERIVRTELKKMQNDGEELRIRQAFDASRRSGIPMVKTWIHSSGKKEGFRAGKFRAKYVPRPHHKAMHGAEVGDGEKFALHTPDGLTWRIDGPHDEILPAAEVINCYCDRAVKIDRSKYVLKSERPL